MFELTRYDLDQRFVGIGVLAGLLSAFALFAIAFYPSVADSAAELETYIENLPPAIRELFGIQSFATLEGFLATEFYQFAWVLLLGLYFAYRAGGLVAGAVEDGRIDLLLSLPIRRRRFLLERGLALVPTMVVTNVVAFVVVLGGAGAIGESLAVSNLAVAHLLSLPYFCACAALGVLLSVLTPDEDRAQRGALGLIFGLFLIDSLSATAGLGWLGAPSPTRYYDPAAILIAGEVDVLGALVLVGGSVVLVAIAVWRFDRTDIA